MCQGQLRKGIKLRPPRSLEDLLTTRYKWSDDDAREFADFLLPMLRYDRRRRATAEQCLRHPWLQACWLPADCGSPPPVQQDSVPVEPSAGSVVPEIEVEPPSADTKCDTAAETNEDNALPMTPSVTVDETAVENAELPC